MEAYKEFNKWLEDEYFDDDTKKELISIKDNVSEINDRFGANLTFGTGGLRGIIGAGTNRMNIYTVRKASQGLANYICKLGSVAMENGIVIAYDSRHKSIEFARESAKVFAGNGIKTYLFNELKPTPELSFAVRFLKAQAGVVITASHNPKEYNGYKVYGPDGGQIPPKAANEILDEINEIKDIKEIKIMNIEEAAASGLLESIGEEIDSEYINHIKELSTVSSIDSEIVRSLKIVFTPLHGTGNKLVRRILKEVGFENVTVVTEQEMPDPDFSTVKSPNPEEKEAFDIALKIAKKIDADIIIGTDPDCDRLGLVTKNPEGKYIILTGNQLGCLMLEYILSRKSMTGELRKGYYAVKTIVTTEMAREITSSFGVELIDVLTGFKFIGEKIKELESDKNREFLFGFEESYGYLAGTFVRDKDGVIASMLAAEVAAFYKSKGMTLYEGLEDLFKRYGYYLEDLKGISLEGIKGLEKIKRTMEKLRKVKPKYFGSFKVCAIRDYLAGYRYCINEEEPLMLPKSDVLFFEMQEGAWFCVRPSGTEPKLKIYFGVKGESMEQAQDKLNSFTDNVMSTILELIDNC